MLIDEMKKEFGQMKFDVVIGNPPYNKGMDLDFVDLGYKISNKYTVMITPAKWQTTADDYSGCASKNINYKQRSEERRVGKECTSWCRSRWSPYH